MTAGSGEFLHIAFTLPDEIEREAMRIVSLLDAMGFDYVHIRKPGWNEERMRHLIEQIPVRLHPRLKLHDHFRLVPGYGLGGIHLNSRNPDCIPDIKTVSRSCHSITELSQPWPETIPEGCICEYQTLSPVFDSISKPGYLSPFDPAAIAEHIAGLRVVALGGVTPERLPMLKALGFAGAAMLGAVWGQT